MTSCKACGHQLGVGRFCTSCGAPVDGVRTDDWRTDTAERKAAAPATDPRTPPSAVAPPPPPRYPLYADEVVGYPAQGPLTTVDPPAATQPAPVAEASYVEDADARPDDTYLHGHDHAHDHAYDDAPERRSPVLWVLATVVVLALLAAGWWFLVRDDGTDRAQDDVDDTSSETSSSAGPVGVDVAARASAQAPETAPPNEDVNGDQVSYDASNMLDGVPETAWRAPGDATGMSLTFTLREPTELFQVGLVNGYAKTSTDDQSRTFDWYLGNRRINAVVWSFDDGTKVRQQLSETRELQMIDVPGVVTSQVVVKLVRVTAPGDGTAARDFTAVSEVSLVGEPA